MPGVRGVLRSHWRFLPGPQVETPVLADTCLMTTVPEDLGSGVGACSPGSPPEPARCLDFLHAALSPAPALAPSAASGGLFPCSFIGSLLDLILLSSQSSQLCLSFLEFLVACHIQNAGSWAPLQ